MYPFINPSPFHTSMGDLLTHFRFHCVDARPALLERDALWASENKALHAVINQLRADLAKREKNEQWLNLSFQTSEEKAESERMKSKKLEEKIVEMEREVAQLRAEKISVERELKEKMCVLVDRVLDLEKEKKTEIEKFEASERLWSAKMEAIRKADADLILKGYVAQEELREKIGILEKEKAEIGRVLKEKMDLETRYKRLEKESNEKISKLEKTAVVLQREKAEQGDEIGRVLKEKIALKTGIKILEEQMEEKMSGLEKKAAGLELDIAKRDLTIGRLLKEKMDLETKNKILEMEARAHMEKKDSNNESVRIVLEREKEVLAAQVSRMAKEICGLVDRNTCVDKEVNEELCGRIKALEKKKGRLEEEVEKKKKRIPELVKTIEMLRDEKRVDDELILNLRSSLEKEKAEKDTEIGRVLEEKMALEELKSCLEKEVEKKKKTIFQLGKTIKTLQDDKRADTELVLKLRSSFETEKAEKATEISRVLEEKMALEELKSYLEEESEKLKRNLEKESLWVSELRGRIELLEKENAEMEAQIQKEKKHVSNEINRALEIQKRLEEAEKQVPGFLETIMVLEREKEALSKKVSKFYEEKRKGTHHIEMLERIHMILNGNLAVEDYEKNNSELADRISVLEREKQELEALIKGKDEVIKVLDKENGWLENVKKELEIVIKVLASKLKEDAYLTDNVGTRSTRQNEGPNSAGVASSGEHHGSVNDSVENSDGNSEAGMTLTNARKRKRSIIKCEETNTEMNNGSLPTNGGNGGEVMVPYRWEADQDLLDAFEVDPELCLKAVCTLYRLHKRLHNSASTSMSGESRVFKPEYLCRAITFGQYLTTEDPECRMTKKLVGKLNRLDPLAVNVCRSIAKQHYLQVYEIYTNKEDPLFLA